MGRGITIMHIYGDELKRLWLILPPLPEQAAIVRYLDYVDRRIRRYVSAKERLIGLLEEEKQAVIHRAVTRGLDPNVPLKPSGVEWLGDVPAHWEVRRTKSFFRLRRTKSPRRKSIPSRTPSGKASLSKARSPSSPSNTPPKPTTTSAPAAGSDR